VQLCGIRPDVLKVMTSLRFQSWFPAEQLHPEDDETFSATLRAVRWAYAGLGRTQPDAATRSDPTPAPEQKLYYLV